MSGSLRASLSMTRRCRRHKAKARTRAQLFHWPCRTIAAQMAGGLARVPATLTSPTLRLPVEWGGRSRTADMAPHPPRVR